ncbi:MAG: GNAT family N-acetyltransferase [Rubricoccaceae bacterium]
MIRAETNRLRLRDFIVSDAPFVFELVNQPSWIENIGDRGVRTLDDARAYITARLRPSYTDSGFGFWCVELLETDVPIGLCGLVKRPQLDAPDIGYALRPAYWGKGYAREAAEATVQIARDTYELTRLVAIVTPTNTQSTRLLENLGMQLESTERMPGDDEDVSVYGMAL